MIGDSVGSSVGKYGAFLMKLSLLKHKQY